jgi:hypothetical protein
VRSDRRHAQRGLQDILRVLRCAAAVAFAAEFALPWAVTGHRVRSGYNLAGVLHDTRLVPNRFVGVIVLFVLAMPVLAAVTIAAELLGAPRAATTSLLLTATLVGVCAFAIGLTRTGPRVAVATIVAVVIALALSLRESGDVDVDVSRDGVAVDD